MTPATTCNKRESWGYTEVGQVGYDPCHHLQQEGVMESLNKWGYTEVGQVDSPYTNGELWSH